MYTVHLHISGMIHDFQFIADRLGQQNIVSNQVTEQTKECTYLIQARLGNLQSEKTGTVFGLLLLYRCLMY
jgi:hypothetical protein